LSIQQTLVLGLGRTGLSVVAYALARGQTVYIYDDDRRSIQACCERYPQVMVWSESLPMTPATVVVASPGVADQHPLIQRARAAERPVINDMEWFVRAAAAPIIAITGTNGKSTVTTLVGQCLQAAGWQVAVGGNIGTPVLELLSMTPDYYVLEVSSFQLDRCPSWRAHIACFLNITPDHLDRYQDFEAYVKSKHRIFQHCQYAVINRDDPAITATAGQVIDFGLSAPAGQSFGICTSTDRYWLSRGPVPIMPVDEVKLLGDHQWANILAVLAIGDTLGIAHQSMRQTIGAFTGLAHRCQRVGHYRGVDWINDSKATNVAAACATITGLSRQYSSIIWIAGGQAKTDDWAPLIEIVVHAPIEHLLVFGQAAEVLANVFRPYLPVHRVEDMSQAVEQAAVFARPAGAVLLAPACASFDMYCNFEKRGEQFAQVVEALSS